jgi:hypothetical protein
MPIRDTDVSKCNSVAPISLSDRKLLRWRVATIDAKFILNQYVARFPLPLGKDEDFTSFFKNPDRALVYEYCSKSVDE